MAASSRALPTALSNCFLITDFDTLPSLARITVDVQHRLATNPIDVLAAPKFQLALGLLMEAYFYAQQTASNPWDFAVDISLLRAGGLSDNDLRYLVRLSYVDLRLEKYGVDSRAKRQFLSTGDTRFSRRTCFILTDNGLDALAASLGRTLNSVAPRDKRDLIIESNAGTLPVWDAQRRVLCFTGKIVKQFRRRAFNQELVLAAFEEESWPLRIYDPLTPHPNHDKKRRLNDTIKCLNRGQERLLLYFRGDGTGEGILWEAAN